MVRIKTREGGLDPPSLSFCTLVGSPYDSNWNTTERVDHYGGGIVYHR